jgi:hypothetical protein
MADIAGQEWKLMGFECNRLVTTLDFAIGIVESFAMLRFLLTFLLLGFALCFSQTATHTDRTLVSEGDYAWETGNGTRAIAHWKLWHLGSGEYEVIESFVRKPLVMQTFRFDAQFLPTGYSLAIPRIKIAANTEKPAVKFTCVYKTAELACQVESEKGRPRSSIPASEPYVVLLDDGWFADFTWQFAGVVRTMEHKGAKEAVVNTYIIRDDNSGGIALKPDKPMKLACLGEKQAEVMGKMQTVRQCEGQEPGDDITLLVTSDGLVAAATLSGRGIPAAIQFQADAVGGAFATADYREYESLGFHVPSVR